MEQEVKQKVITGLGGVILGAAFTATLGFSPLVGWKNKQDYTRMVDAAVVSAQAKVCAAQFNKAPNSSERLKDLKALPYSDKSKFVTKGGWDSIPGEDKTSDVVTQACIDRLEAGTDK